MLDTKSKFNLVTDLRYALDVMEEYSHLGLNDQMASKLREILVRQIDDARAGLSCCPPAPKRIPISLRIYG